MTDAFKLTNIAIPLGPMLLIEAISVAFCITRIALGPITQFPSPPIWLFAAVFICTTYFALASKIANLALTNILENRPKSQHLFWLLSVPYVVIFSAELLLLQFKPDIGGWVWDYLSIIQPFPSLAMVIVLLLVFLLKMLTLRYLGVLPSGKPLERIVDRAIPIALLVIGVLQASVYIIPIGNAFLRFWAIADAIPMGIGYPVTLTEDGPMKAGSPPYVYDLPLFPILILGAFYFFGHNTIAAFLPSFLFNALFPLSLYLLIKRATKSRVVAISFACLAALFPYLRFWVLNLPDPDPFLLTSLCFAAYFYLRALNTPEKYSTLLIAGIAAGALSLARPEGVLYAGFLTLGLIVSRPRIKQFALYAACLGAFLIPMIVTWLVNFGFLWPQNYNRTLGLQYPMENYQILRNIGGISLYHRGLGLSEEMAFALLGLFALSALIGTIIMAGKDRHLLAIAIPGIGNTVLIFFANPYIPNTFHYADFFRHASFGVPLLVMASAYGFYQLFAYTTGRRWSRTIAIIGLIMLVMTVAREGDILGNPTATHHPNATQALTSNIHLSLQDIIDRPIQLPQMDYRWDGSVIVASCNTMTWPDDLFSIYRPLDMSFDTKGRPFGYASVAAFLIGLCFALLAEVRTTRKSLGQSIEVGPQNKQDNR